MTEFDENTVHRFWRGPMKFIRATLAGGMLFLVPFVILAVILGKAMGLVHQVTDPLSERVGVAAVAGIPTPRLLAALLVLLICFLAGLFARTRLAKRMVRWLESAILSSIPGYSLMKSMGEQIAGVKDAKLQEVVLARIEDAWQIAFLVERLREGQVAVFVPGAPNPWSGSVYLMTEDRIKPLDVPRMEAVKCLKQLGIGSDALLGQPPQAAAPPR